MSDVEGSDLDHAVRLAQEIAKRHDPHLSEKTFEIVLQFLLSGEQSSPSGTVGKAGAQRRERGGRASVGMQLNEFLAQLGAKTHPDRVTAIAYYVFKERDEPVTIAEIVDAYNRARLKKPQNLSDVIGSCVRRGYLVDADRKDGAKAWVITGNGEQFVEESMKA